MRPARNQESVPAGLTRYFCSACMRMFLEHRLPDACPNGHPARQPSEDFGDIPRGALVE